MKRSELKSLGLEDNVIDEIMKLNGNDINRFKSEREEYLEEIKELKASMTDKEKSFNDKLKEKENEINDIKNSKGDYEGLEAKYNDLKTKYDNDLADLNGKLEAKDYNYGIEKFLGEYEFASNLAKEAVMNKFKEKSFKLEDGKFGEDATTFMNELKENDQGAFKVQENEAKNGTYQYTPKGSNSDANDMASQINAILGI